VVNPPEATVDGVRGRRYVPRAMLHIVVNGEERAVSEGTTIASLLAALGLSRQHVAVEANREIVPRTEHDARTLAEGDRLEIVTFVGGG
jgi:sulfur carrier protein